MPGAYQRFIMTHMLKTAAGNLRSQLARERKARAQLAEGRGYRHFAAEKLNLNILVSKIEIFAQNSALLREENPQITHENPGTQATHGRSTCVAKVALDGTTKSESCLVQFRSCSRTYTIPVEIASAIAAALSSVS